jgi:sugar/nucleoside kinase (ribokinase family)
MAGGPPGEATFDVVAIGNAIVDVLAHADDSFLDANALAKGTMTLVDAGRALALYERMAPAVEISGGSAANTMAGIGSLGGRGRFIGKVATDQLGDVFHHDIRAAGVAFDTTPASDSGGTGRCLIFVTPDAQRTMQTYLGAAAGVSPADIDRDTIAAAQITYLEGYLWDEPAAKQAFLAAAKIAHQAGRRVALTLSDPFCVERHRAEFLDLVEAHVDVLFANEAEITSLYELRRFDDALQAVRAHCEVAALTRSEKGAVIVAGEEVHVIDAVPVERVVDTTGAGDQYAAGFLHAITRGMDVATAGRIGALCAAEVISHFGARPETSLAALVVKSALR